MRTQKVFTNLTCNQNCTYCVSREPSDDRRFIAPAAVIGRIDAAIARGAREVVLSGGEPTLRRDLSALVARARAGGADVVLETNATGIDDARARALAASGLALARVNLSGWGAGLDEITRDPGGFDRALAGMAALTRAGVRLEVALALVRRTLPLLEGLPRGLAAALGEGAVRAIFVTTPVTAPDPSELISYDDAIRAIEALDREARSVGIPVQLTAGSGPPPCLLPPRGNMAHVFTLTPGASARDGHVRIPACTRCQIADRCAGLSAEYLARWPVPDARPITEDRARRRLSLVGSVSDQVRRELVSRNLATGGRGAALEHIIRVNFHCNQSCRFCFVSTHLPAPDEVAVREAIREAAEKGARIVLSGGEPTLNPRLAEYVELSAHASRLPVELQTNAILLEDRALVDRLVAAGLQQVFVSLHGSSAEISDVVTGAPGTFARTVIGIDNLAGTNLRLILNFVICEANYRELVPFVRLVAARWPRAWLNISFVAPSTDVVPRDRALVPKYSDAMPHLTAAIALANAERLEIMGFESMCGVPLCLVPIDLARYFTMEEIPEGFDGGEFVRPPACSSCGLNNRCYGLRRGYAELHGTDELRAIPGPDGPSAASVIQHASALGASS
jgi:MoaA/NifB/PqqE/SkfB family radical SAM enzyme